MGKNENYKNFKLKQKKSNANFPIIIININLIKFYMKMIFLFSQLINISGKYILSKRKINLKSEITMTIKGIGEQNILSDFFEDLPDEIYVNGDYKTNKVNKIDDLIGNENIIKLIWNTPLTNLNYMFAGLSNIINIDFNKFDTSGVTDMEGMFFECFSITSLELSNFKTSSVTNMQYLFYNCSSLISLDLSFFDTSLVTNMQAVFKDCSSLIYLNIKNFNTKLVTDMSLLFYNCNSLTFLNVKHFDTSLVTDMYGMFGKCSSLISIELNNFNTSMVTNMEQMFDSCKSLLSLDLSKFNISLVKNADFMFSDCTSLIYLNLISFIRDDILNISLNNMFHNINGDLILCLDSRYYPYVGGFIPINNFNNFNCENKCFSNSTKIDINDKTCVNNCETTNSKYEYNKICYLICPFNTHISPIQNNLCIESLYCEKLNKFYNYEQTLCIDKIPEGFFISNTIMKTIDKCHLDCKECLKKEDENSSNCISCLNNKFLDNGNCVTSCENDYFVDIFGNQKCKCIINKCKECSIDSKKLDLCISCNDGYYPKQGDETNKNNFINCYKEPDGYYLENNIYKPCYQTCKKCSRLGNEPDHKCLECKPGYSRIDNTQNCYENCEYYYYFEPPKQYHCTEIEECPEEQKKLIKEKNKCVKNCIEDDIYKCEYNNVCYESCPKETSNINSDNLELTYILDIKPDNSDNSSKSYDLLNSDFSSDKPIDSESNNNKDNNEKECPYDMPYQLKNGDCVFECNAIDFFNGVCKISNDNSTIQENMIDIIKNQLKNNDLDSLLSNVEDGEKEDLLIKAYNVTYQITTTDNQNNKNYSNISTIKLQDCEDILKRQNNIDSNKSLIIFKVDYYMDGLSIPVIGYEVYHPDTKVQLNLRECENALIDLDIPVSIDENILFKYDPNNEYYTDECFAYTSENGADILLNDRKEEFINRNMSLCENNCSYKGYNEETKKASCKCEIKSKELKLSEIFDEENILSNNFTFEKESKSNIMTMKCANTLFTKVGLLTNIANYVLLFFILGYIIFFILYLKFGHFLIDQDIGKILSDKRKMKNINDTLNNKIKVNEKKSEIGNPLKNKKFIKNKVRKSKSRKGKIQTRNGSKSISKIELKNTNIIINLGKEQNSQLKIYNKKNKKINKNHIKDFHFYDSELNSLPYQLALKFDNRTYFNYYISLLKTKHPLVYSFLPNVDYNLVIIKLSILILSFALYYSLNTLFFNYREIHKIYENNGNISMSSQMPKIIYSFIISHIICCFIKYFSLSERNLLSFKYVTQSEETSKSANEVRRCLFIKYIVFYVTGIVFLFAFWYYLSSFAAVYQNSQIYPFINTLMSILISLLYPFIFNLIPGLFRIPSLNKNRNSEFLYKIAQILQYI